MVIEVETVGVGAGPALGGALGGGVKRNGTGVDVEGDGAGVVIDGDGLGVWQCLPGLGLPGLGDVCVCGDAALAGAA
jgi:hypothetical protein